MHRVLLNVPDINLLFQTLIYKKLTIWMRNTVHGELCKIGLFQYGHFTFNSNWKTIRKHNVYLSFWWANDMFQNGHRGFATPKAIMFVFQRKLRCLQLIPRSWRHLNLLWNTNMIAWLKHDNKSLQKCIASLVWAKLTRYLGNNTAISSLSIDGQLKIRITGRQKLGIHANKLPKIGDKTMMYKGSYFTIVNMMTSSNENIFSVTGPLCGEFTGHRWIPRTKASDAELWCFLWSAPE